MPIGKTSILCYRLANGHKYPVRSRMYSYYSIISHKNPVLFSLFFSFSQIWHFQQKRPTPATAAGESCGIRRRGRCFFRQKKRTDPERNPSAEFPSAPPCRRPTHKTRFWQVGILLYRSRSLLPLMESHKQEVCNLCTEPDSLFIDVGLYQVGLDRTRQNDNLLVAISIARHRQKINW